MLETTSRKSLLVGFALSAYVVSLLIAGCMSMLLAGRVTSWSTLLGFVGAGLMTRWASRVLFPPDVSKRVYVRVVVLALLIVIAAAGINALIYDSSWDGQGYQSEGVIAVTRGWNIYRDAAPPDSYFSTWLAYFSKGPWVIAGSLSVLTGDVESGKAAGLVLMAASFAYTLTAFTTFGGLKRSTVILLAALVALNPIAVAQLFTYYVDGLMASALSCVVCLLIIIARKPDPAVWVALVMTSILVVSFKLNGGIYLAVIAGGYALWYWFARRPGGTMLLACGVAAYVIGVLFLSYNPFVTQYVSQLVETGDPFHPTDWETLIAIDYNTPDDLRGKSWPEKFAQSLFSHYSNRDDNALKIPFTVSFEEVMWGIDARLSGFGPFFSGAVVLAVAAVLLNARRANIYPAYLIVLMGTIGLSVVINSEAWWARYVPQFWLLILLAIAPLLGDDRSSAVWARAAAGVLLFNAVLLLLFMVVGSIFNTAALRMHLSQLQGTAVTVEVDFEGFALTRYHFDQRGIAYRSVESLTCPQDRQKQLWPSQAQICRVDGSEAD